MRAITGELTGEGIHGQFFRGAVDSAVHVEVQDTHRMPDEYEPPEIWRETGEIAARGPLLIVVDQPNTIGALPVTVARACGHDVAYLPGLSMRRIADLYPGQAKTDARDAHIIADAARTMPHTLRRVDVGDTHHSGSSTAANTPPDPATTNTARPGPLRLRRLHDPASRHYYDRKRAEGKERNAALICLARRRCDVRYAVLKSKELYRDPISKAA